MPFYAYKARGPQGEMINGEVEAGNETAVIETLRRRSATPISIKPITSLSDNSNRQFDLNLLFARHVGLDELVVFTRQMYALVRAGIPVIRAIIGLGENTNSKLLGQALLDVANQLERGRTLSVAMNNHPKIFNRMMVSIVHVGENTGKLDEAFLQLSEYYEKEQETRKRIKQATRYPIFVLIAIVAAMFILNIFVIPTFATMFAKFDAELPWTTRFLLDSSAFFVDFWYLVLAMIVGGSYSIGLYIKTDQGRYIWDRYKLKMPIMGSIVNRSILGRFARSFAMMLQSGVPLTNALNLVSDAVDNAFMANRIVTMRQNIEKGESLLRSSVKSELFTPLVLQMVAVGEETGRVDELLLEVASFYEREVDFDLKNLTAKIEPILISIVAGMVLILALGIFTPMWDMMSTLQGG